ncbi:hypothetical protein GCM10011380_11190 [Sphingomonas metalli]|uniref:Uncharacterized protein n=1 Tax=Sphingomonas metalli TaxID=1779358 RepID=A0A916SYR3_9SPHN|nr:hypothetical protein [Sphingomonas metalli]GGB23255.1 hypothetical protein GCM10011380_11190 [Sphingomonas metalli]
MARLASSEFGNMKKSSDWVRQPGLDKKLDHLVEERGCTPAELVPYDAAKALDIKPSGEFYRKVRDWKQRRAAENDAPVMEVPPHVQAEFRETVDRFAAEAMSSFLRAVRGVGGDLNRVATLRITDAEHRADEAQAEVNGLLDHWTAAEAQRDAALARIAELEQALADARRREEVATVRLEERDALLRALRPGTSDNGSAAIMPSVPVADRASVGDDDNRQVGDVAIDASSASAGQSVADVDADGPEQPPVIYTDHPEGGQVEMPLVTNDDAGQADVGGDSRG